MAMASSRRALNLIDQAREQADHDRANEYRTTDTRYERAQQAYDEAKKLKGTPRGAYLNAYADGLMGVKRDRYDGEAAIVSTSQGKSKKRKRTMDNNDDDRIERINRAKTFFSALYRGQMPKIEGRPGSMPKAVVIVVWGIGMFVLFQVTLGNFNVSLILAGIAMREAYARATAQTVERWAFNSILLGILPTLPTWMGSKWPLVVAIIIHGFLWKSLPWVTQGRHAGDDKDHDGAPDKGKHKEDDMPDSV